MIRYHYNIDRQTYVVELFGNELHIGDYLRSQPSISLIFDELCRRGKWVPQQVNLVEEFIEDCGVDPSKPIWNQGTLQFTREQVVACDDLGLTPGWCEVTDASYLFRLLQESIDRVTSLKNHTQYVMNTITRESK